jgi:putative membrane protein
MKRAKIIAGAVIAALLIVIVVQNRQPVATKLLFVTVTMPRAMLLLVSILMGFVLGLLAANYLIKRRG